MRLGTCTCTKHHNTSLYFDPPRFLELFVPVPLEARCHGPRLVNRVQASQVFILDGVPPTPPDLTVLPPPCDTGEERCVLFGTGPSLNSIQLHVRAG